VPLGIRREGTAARNISMARFGAQVENKAAPRDSNPDMLNFCQLTGGI